LFEVIFNYEFQETEFMCEKQDCLWTNFVKNVEGLRKTPKLPIVQTNVFWMRLKKASH
jgi:hypothetical protein